MAENVYEGLCILDSNRYGRDPEKVSGQLPEMIKNAGGEILVSRLWEERRLAYPINGQRKGTYWLTYFRLDTEKLASIQRDCQLSDTIHRVLFLKVEPRIVDALVAHATGNVVKPEAESAEGKSAEGKSEEGGAAKSSDDKAVEATPQ